MSLSPVERVIGSIEDLSSLSIDELTELCFDQQFPDFHKDEDNTIGYIPKGAEFTLENFVDIRPAVSEYHKIKHEHEYKRAIGKLLLKRKLEQAEAAKYIPRSGTPVFAASREFKNIIDLRTKSWGRGPWDEYFHIIDRRVVDGSGRVLLGSESRKYELTCHYEFLGQEGQTLRGQNVSAYFTAGYPPEMSPYDYYDDRPDPYTALITEDELRTLLIKWGELDRPIQLEIGAA